MSANAISSMRSTPDSATAEPTAEDGLRARIHDLLAGLLATPPDAATLEKLRSLRGDHTPLGEAFAALAARATHTDAEAAEREYDRLFIGLGRGEVVPYASFHLTGFLNEKPLAALRRDMARLGIAPAEDATEPEDHIASLLWMMAGLIEGDFGAPATLAEQRVFFETHMRPWAERFFNEVENAAGAELYRPVGTIGRLFMEIEAAAFAME